VRLSRRSILGSIFINYRRQDSEGEAGRLFDEMEKHFGEQSVFMDVAGIEPGQDFRKAIDQGVASCSVLLALIGQQWLDASDSSGRRRLDDPGDFVRIELASALRSNIPIVPILVHGSRMPLADELSEDLKDLAYRNAFALTHARWKSDIQLLLRALRPYMGTPNEADRPPTEPLPSARESSLPQPILGGNVGIGSALASIDQQAVDRVSRELAHFLGPIANVLVRRATQRATSLDDLCSTVAREIISDADRSSFLRSCRS
jgi:TIR domain